MPRRISKPRPYKSAYLFEVGKDDFEYGIEARFPGNSAYMDGYQAAKILDEIREQFGDFDISE